MDGWMTHHLVKDLISFLDALCKNYKTAVSTTASSNLQTKSLYSHRHVDPLQYSIKVAQQTNTTASLQVATV